MARPRGYDPDTVLDAVLDTFWERGYEATSIADLVAATGVQRFGLYQTWGDKRGLLEAALARYCDRVAQGLFASLHGRDAGLPHIRGYLEGLASFVTAPSGSRACFVLNTLVELGGPAAQQFPVLRDHLDGLRAAFAAALTQARERGELPSTADLDAHADHLAIVAQAVLLQGRTGASPEALRHFLDLSLSTLES